MKAASIATLYLLKPLIKMIQWFFSYERGGREPTERRQEHIGLTVIVMRYH
ncbi:hypothetical protein GCM10008915_57790 [Bifidobacterium pullorum subsp. gallinarum]